MADKLNVCLISREFLPDTAFGGMATFSLDVAKVLKARGHDVTVFSQSLSKTYVTEHEGIKLHKIKILSPFNSYGFLPLLILGFNFCVLREVFRSHKEKPFDVIDVPDHLAEGLFATFSGIPVVTRLHTPYALLVSMGLNNYKIGLSYWLIKLAEQLALRRSTVLYAPCMDLVRRCDRLLSIGHKPIKIFGYPLDLELFSPRREERDNDSIRILFLGRLEQRKGIETIAAAFPKVFEAQPNVTLTLVGRDTHDLNESESARQYLSRFFTTNGCIEAVRFEDYVALERLPDFFTSHDIVWVPSIYDNYPLICLEAMACAKAVIVADSGGLPEMVKHQETGLIFQTGNAENLLSETIKLCRDSSLRQNLGKQARHYVEKACSEEHIYNETMELYRLALSEYSSWITEP